MRERERETFLLMKGILRGYYVDLGECATQLTPAGDHDRQEGQGSESSVHHSAALTRRDRHGHQYATLNQVQPDPVAQAFLISIQLWTECGPDLAVDCAPASLIGMRLWTVSSLDTAAACALASLLDPDSALTRGSARSCLLYQYTALGRDWH